MVNPITALVAAGYPAALAAACAPGEGYFFCGGRTGGTATPTADIEDQARRLEAAAAGLHGSASLWCTASTSGERVAGEIILRPAKGQAIITWDLADGTVRFRLPYPKSATFPSMVEMAQAVMDPVMMLEAMGERADEIMRLVAGLGYRIDWRPSDDLRQTVEILELAEA